ncbi:MAG: zonular occludens toxin domain-containing protein [Nanoarchaeota archaeon]|nr:zonular occludens toxin domain-containing protein [Nanoarchaeota archaeon]
MAKKSSKKSSRKKKKSFSALALKYLFLGIWYALKYICIGIFSVFKWIFLKIKGKVKEKKEAAEAADESERELPKGPVSEIKIIETVKGDYDSFLDKLKESDSLIGLVIGARGSGKTAVALSIIENIRGQKKNVFAMGISNLPKWIKTIENIDEIKNDSLVVIDEGGILFSSRNSMSDANKLLSQLLFIARHKNLTILFISQNSSNLEINTLRQADFMIFKKSSLLQKNFERKIVAKIYEEYVDGFEKHKDKKGLTLVYSDDFVGFVENTLPSFWSSKVSKSFR